MGDILSNVGIGKNPYHADSYAIQKPVTDDQANAAYGTATSALAQQQAFLNALSQQNGVQNQTAVFNQLQGIANGTGPNPGQAALNQATGANVANQAAMMAGQRGAAANPALIARMAAQQGGALQQQAAGQGATMQAQQQMNALGQMGQVAGQQVGNQAASLQGYNQAAQSEQQNLLGAIGNQNNAGVAMQANMNNYNAGLANTRMQGQQAMIGGIMNGAGKAAAMAHGGTVNYDGGGAVAAPQTPGGPESSFGQFLSNSKPVQQQSTQPASPQGYGGAANSGATAMQTGMSSLSAGLAKLFGGGTNPPLPINQMAGGPGDATSSAGAAGTSDMLSSAGPAMMVARGGPIMGEQYAMQMEPVPGAAKVKGDSLKNDTVPAKLSPGEIILPRSVTMHPNAPEKAAEFVRAIMAKKGTLPRKR